MKNINMQICVLFISFAIVLSNLFYVPSVLAKTQAEYKKDYKTESYQEKQVSSQEGKSFGQAAQQTQKDYQQSKQDYQKSNSEYSQNGKQYQQESQK